MAKPYLHEAWYQAAWSDELSEMGSLTRTLLGMPVLLTRGSNGGIAALVDRCPHRFVPLSRGRFDGELVTCGYHGLVFDSAGQCVRNPHGPITERARIRSFPAVERYGRVWLWFGDPDCADSAMIPDLSFLDPLPASAVAHSYMSVETNWLLIVDNLLDLTHSDYVHPAFGDFVTDAEMTVDESKDGLSVGWIARDQETPHIYRANLPSDRSDIWLRSNWLTPSTIVVGTGATAPGSEPEWSLWSLHGITPESETRSHYFFGFARDFNLADADFTLLMQNAGTAAFVNEDKPILEAQQMRVGEADLFDLDPLVLPSDRGAVLARRRLRKLISAQPV
ncbi:aromatic ring-hydroxylating dioxygenase subunit alpha [Novosphingobium sp. KN65.2]|uniref:aromatic ring-hydroxylating dioxygenase subunit alpha n=1 Tax=Novosphingobium sp. KN65.2 TaxID=1478134 RepID=UPI0005DAC23A|nr:aromatic ring-hydroxylating dioxygenase subunit alpha [Novosphingobium sp. KN65.2]CDO38558.1 Vanillate monooxygenase [Novosphingobium sp. KN65.2]